MKTFTEYLAESKKYYVHKIKVAGELPENFVDDVKSRLAKYEIASFEQVQKTPIQKLPLDFPELENAEVTIFEVSTEYPTNPQQLEVELKEIGIDASRFRIRNPNEPSEIEQAVMDSESADEDKDALLDQSDYEEMSAIEHKDYFGDDFNKSFLQDLAKTSKERIQELGLDKMDANVYSKEQKTEERLSPVGSK
jgi:hypothetical protein